MKFQYKKFRTIDGKIIYKPVIPIELVYQNTEYKYEALIDSGADFCIFHSDIGRVLGIPVEKGEVETFGGIGGLPMKSFAHPIKIRIGGHELRTQARFSPEIAPFGFGVLGQIGLFDKFVVKFDYQKKSIELVPKWIKR